MFTRRDASKSPPEPTAVMMRSAPRVSSAMMAASAVSRVPEARSDPTPALASLAVIQAQADQNGPGEQQIGGENSDNPTAPIKGWKSRSAPTVRAMLARRCSSLDARGPGPPLPRCARASQGQHPGEDQGYGQSGDKWRHQSGDAEHDKQTPSIVQPRRLRLFDHPGRLARAGSRLPRVTSSSPNVPHMDKSRQLTRATRTLPGLKARDVSSAEVAPLALDK